MTSDLVHLAATARHMPMTDAQHVDRLELRASRRPLLRLRGLLSQLGRRSSSRDLPAASRAAMRTGT
jgi:hypothetical protein